jgi:transposase
MANVLSMDLPVRFKTLMDQGLCAAAAGKMLRVSPATAARWGKKGRGGASLEPHPAGPRKGRGRLAPFMPVCLEPIEQDPDITLAELQAALLAAHDVTASTRGIDALLRRHGSSYKKRPDRRRPPQARGAKGATGLEAAPEGHARAAASAGLS